MNKLSMRIIFCFAMGICFFISSFVCLSVGWFTSVPSFLIGVVWCTEALRYGRERTQTKYDELRRKHVVSRKELPNGKYVDVTDYTAIILSGLGVDEDYYNYHSGEHFHD